MTNVLIAGGAGMLGSRITHYLLENDVASVRVLARSASPADADKARILDDLRAAGAEIVEGDLGNAASLDAATTGVDVVISAVQGGPDVMIDGQLALARAAEANGARRFVASDFALDLFHAPEGAPMFDSRKQADKALDATGLEVIHILNGGFMDMMLDPHTADIVNLDRGTAQYWGSGNEPFNLTTVEDTAKFTARIAVDETVPGGVYSISGAETTFNSIIEEVERLSGKTFERQVYGSLDDLQQKVDAASNPWHVVREWYFISMLTTPPFATVENDRYADMQLTTLQDHLADVYAKAV